MSSGLATASHSRLAEQTAAPDYAARVCETLQRLRSATDVAACATLLQLAAHRLGVDAAMFSTILRVEPAAATCRTLLACDARWGMQCIEQGWCLDNPWWRHTLHSPDPVRSSRLALEGRRDDAFVQAAAAAGFRSALIVPSPSPFGASFIGMLVLGSHAPGTFDGEGCDALELLAWPLAMTLQTWWRARFKQELALRSRLTADELALLRYEARGQGSKRIAAELDTLPQTIDCRFQRLNRKLAVTNRKAAARLVQICGLI